MITIDNVPVKITKFPDGTSKFEHTCLTYARKEGSVCIKWLYDNDAELFELQCLVDWLREHGVNNISLFMPYVPNARMDRVQNPYEMFTLKTFAKIINDMHFTIVTTIDIHSNVGAALIDNIENIIPVENISEILDMPEMREHKYNDELLLYFPDEGAMKRYAYIAKCFNLPYVFGMKNRDWATGEIKGLSVLGETDKIKDSHVLIIDDICSKGGTFYHSARELRKLGAKTVRLYVSHLENTVHSGELLNSIVDSDPNNMLITDIFTTNSIYREGPDYNPARIHIIREY